MAFNRPLQESLNNYRITYNAHRIRKQGKDVQLPTGHSPDVMWENPQLFGKGAHLFQVLQYWEGGDDFFSMTNIWAY